MVEFIKKNWKNVSLMLLLFIITVYFVIIGEKQFLATTIIPMIAIGLNLTSDQ